MTVDIWIVISILLGTIFCLFLLFRTLSSQKILALQKDTPPPPTEILIGPKAIQDSKETKWRSIGKSREFDEISLVLKTVVGFYDTVYVGESYSCKVFIFNTAKNADKAEELIRELMAKDEQKRFETDTLYAKDQEPAKIKIDIFAPYFTISPASRIIEVPGGTIATSTHIFAPINVDPKYSVGKSQIFLINFEQILESGAYHLGSLEYKIKVEKATIEQESEIKTQQKIKYISSAVSTATALLTGISILITILSYFGILAI